MTTKAQPKRINISTALAMSGKHLRALRDAAKREDLWWYFERATAALDELNAARVQLERDRRALDAATKRIERKVNHVEKQTRQLATRLQRGKSK